jgi:hypothetical protein
VVDMTIPVESRASFTRFEFVGETLTPVRYVKEWVYPRDGAPKFATVRISEHKWPLKCMFSAKDNTVDWPSSPKREPITAQELVDLGLLTFDAWHPLCTGEPVLRMDNAAWARWRRGPQGPNDGLPDDYLDFWHEAEDLGSEM